MTNLIQWQPQSADKRGDLGIYGKVVKEGGGGSVQKRGRLDNWCFVSPCCRFVKNVVSHYAGRHPILRIGAKV